MTFSASPPIISASSLSYKALYSSFNKRDTMRFVVTWRHSDGSLVEFSEKGWKSADTEKNDWLTTMNSLCSTAPAIPPVIKQWLEENCELVDFQGSPDLLITNRLCLNQKATLNRLELMVRQASTVVPAIPQRDICN